MKKFFKIFGITVLVLLIGFIFLFRSLTASLPDGVAGEQADQLARRMLASLNDQGYKNIEKLSWNFRDRNAHVWDRKNRTVLVQGQETTVMLDFRSGQHQVLKSNDQSEEEIIESAIASFYNDSFWLVAPFKVFDKGVERKYVETEDGPGLLVTYTSGGVTPGDSYLWVLDENFRPKYWRIWTSSVRVKGMKFRWKNWKQYQGVWLATDHKAQIPINIKIKDLKVE